MKFCFLVFAGSFALMCCNQQTLNSDLYKREWMLVGFSHYSKEFLIQNQAGLNLTGHQSNPNSQSAFMGCTSIFLKSKFSHEKVVFFDITQTEMFCEDKMELEKDFVTALPQIKKYKIEGHFLTLTDEKENKMKFVAVDWD